MVIKHEPCQWKLLLAELSDPTFRESVIDIADRLGNSGTVYLFPDDWLTAWSFGSQFFASSDF